MSFEGAYKEFDAANLGPINALKAAGQMEQAKHIAALPSEFQDEVACYVMFGSPPRDPMLIAVIENALDRAFREVRKQPYLAKAREHLDVLVFYFDTHAPTGSWGHQNARLDWQNACGLIGMQEGKS